MKQIFFFFNVLFVTLILSDCIILPPGVKEAAAPANLEDPDKHRVDSADYPTFRVRRKFKPPLWKEGPVESQFPMVPIEQSDTWKVTHKINDDLFLIYSESYNERQCRYLADALPRGMAGGHVGIFSNNCDADYLYQIPITLDGTVKGNWKLFYNPKRFIFSRDRYVNMQIDQANVEEWGPQPLFMPVQR